MFSSDCDTMHPWDVSTTRWHFCDWLTSDWTECVPFADVCTYSGLCYFRDMRGILEEWKYLWKAGYLQISGRRVLFFSAMVMVILLHFSLKVRTGLLSSPRKDAGLNHKNTSILPVCISRKLNAKVRLHTGNLVTGINYHYMCEWSSLLLVYETTFNEQTLAILTSWHWMENRSCMGIVIIPIEMLSTFYSPEMNNLTIQV